MLKPMSLDFVANLSVTGICTSPKDIDDFVITTVLPKSFYFNANQQPNPATLILCINEPYIHNNSNVMYIVRRKTMNNFREDMGAMNPCRPNGHNEKFDRVVAQWETVRHYDIKYHDELRPVCTDGLRNESFEKHAGCGCEVKENTRARTRCGCMNF
jgi:hypothetical protein